jgi:hypothetical protein
MGATFAITEAVVANTREKDDSWNGIAGGCAAGFLAGVRGAPKRPAFDLSSYALMQRARSRSPLVHVRFSERLSGFSTSLVRPYMVVALRSRWRGESDSSSNNPTLRSHSLSSLRIRDKPGLVLYSVGRHTLMRYRCIRLAAWESAVCERYDGRRRSSKKQQRRHERRYAIHVQWSLYIESSGKQSASSGLA